MSYRSVFRPGMFSGQTIVVTGGGSGIGRCTAHELAALGGHVVLTGRTLEKLESVAAEIAEDGGQASVYPFDIRDEDAVRDNVAGILAERGRIHGLVNNAGGQFLSPLALISKNGFDAVVATNLTGGFLMAREVFTQCMADHGGAIVNMLADMWRGMPGMGHSGAARGGMENFTRTAAAEWSLAGVRVNAVAPGSILSSGLQTYEKNVRSEILKLRHSVPLKRLGSEAEVSAAIVFLLSEGAAYITGTTLRIDGGSILSARHLQFPDHDRSAAYDGFHRSVRPAFLDDEE